MAKRIHVGPASAKPGDEVYIVVDDEWFLTVIDEQGVQRFKADPVTRFLCDSGKLDLNAVQLAFQEGRFSKSDIVQFYMRLGYSVDDLRDAIAGITIENPPDE